MPPRCKPPRSEQGQLPEASYTKRGRGGPHIPVCLVRPVTTPCSDPIKGIGVALQGRHNRPVLVSLAGRFSLPHASGRCVVCWALALPTLMVDSAF